MKSAVTIPHEFFQNELKGFVYKRVKDMPLTEDILHDVFLKVQSRSAQLKENERVTAWIYQIARNTIVDHFRRQSRPVDLTELQGENETHNFNDCVAHSLKELLKTLPLKYREAFELAELDSLSQLELARRLGLSYSGTKSRVQRARLMLRQKLEELLILKTDPYGNIVVCQSKTPYCCQ